VTEAIRKVHDFLTVGSPAPLQEGVAAAIESLGRDYYAGLSREYRERRDTLVPALQAAGFKCVSPEGAYYVLADFSAFSDAPDNEFAFWLTREIGVAPVPGSSFYSRPELGRTQVRFAFCKTLPMLKEAAGKLGKLKAQR